MKYKPGQKVKIRRDYNYNEEALHVLEKNNYILTIKSGSHSENYDSTVYILEEIEYMKWQERYIERYIEGVYIEPKPEPEPEPIDSRFEILDL